MKPNKPNPSLHSVSKASSLLRFGLPPPSRIIFYAPVSSSRFYKSRATSLVPYKSPWYVPACFTPSTMQSVNRSPIALFFCHIRKRSRIFSVLPVPLRGFNHRFKFFSSVSIIYRNHLFPLFLIVHHNSSFAPLQHKVICKLLLSVVCGRPFSFIFSVRRPSDSLRLRSYHSDF